MQQSRGLRAAVVLALMAVSSPTLAQTSTQSFDEVRNTVINLLEALVQKGVMTREQAESMVASAQAKASATAKAQSDRDAAEAGAVRVTYVPETVRQQIGQEVSARIKDDVTQQVVAQAQADGWGVPGALPEWIKNVRLYGDVRSRFESDTYADDNATNVYLNFNEVNAAGGVGRAGVDALLNTTEDRHRLVGRLRTGAMVQLGNSFALDFRLTGGNALSAVSTNQTLGNYGGRWQFNVDKAAVLWNPVNSAKDREMDVRFGRFSNPFVTNNELLWDNDVTFEGLSATYAMDFFGTSSERMERGLFLTLGAFSLQEVELSKDDKWLYGAQLGTQIGFGTDSFLRFTASYYDYENVTGIRNTLDSDVYDYTAPRFLQKGNTVFDIRNDNDTTTNLYALAGEYSLASANVLLDLGFGRTHVMVGGEYVKNVGWDQDDVAALTGQTIDERVEGYEVGVIVGQPTVAALWDWRAFMLYRYLERDAVLDAFTDSDFHLGGTDAKGYQLGFDLGLARGAWVRLRYLSANEVDGPPLGIDVWQLDVNGQF
ncbi:polyhydroxyalkanoate synthesis regulator phasin [Povalibacter uvarum]|uniref:Polyhydroxyalkanoate synthesis regulator phasin n=1 Tax=Povalibacter uvarum TaxID=732238 RepID=A0A841HFL9_9GAMM|nr:putative porin [Povalibacter uvarum]MBB6091239.1 polyhydroxyalkanoate synthesis regulator phasin [Povalibacter uvarum]